MRWEDYRMSENVDDRRGDGGYGGGGGTGVGISGGGLGIGTLVVLGFSVGLGVDPRLLISGAEMMGAGRGPSSSYSEPQRPVASGGAARRRHGPLRVRSRRDERGRLEGRAAAADGRALASAEARHVQRRVTNSACGTAQSAMGPLSIARATSKCISTRRSSVRCNAISAAAANSPTLM